MYRTKYPQEQLEFNAEMITAMPAFEKLLDLSLNVCLREPARFDAIMEQKLEAERIEPLADPVVNKIGLWGLRSALEFSVGRSNPFRKSYFVFPGEENEELSEEEKEEREGPALGILAGGGIVKLAPNRETQLKIEAFGEALLEEAFLSLGDDAPQKVREFKDAKNTKEQIAVCNWLLSRIGEIRKAAKYKFRLDDEDRPEQIFIDRDGNASTVDPQFPDMIHRETYPPIRVAPKMIGTYPEVRVTPSCLGISMLMSSFFEKAGVEYLHSGVAMTAGNDARVAMKRATTKTIKFADTSETPLQDHFARRAEYAATKLDEIVERDDPFHMAVLVKLKNDHWIQFDPNFGSNEWASRDDSQMLTDCYDSLLGLKHSAKGTEMMVLMASSIGSYGFLSAHKKLREISPEVEDIERFLEDLPADGALAEIVNNTFAFYFTDYAKDATEQEYGFAQAALQSDMADAAQSKDQDHHHVVQDALYSTLFDYVFPDHNNLDISRCIERCRTDANYRRARAQDLKMAPLYALHKLQNIYGNAVIERDLGMPHSLHEIGLPAYQIGACTLSDFATYYGDDLPPGFWAAHWPSQANLMDRFRKLPDSETQRTAMSVAYGQVILSRLTYYNIDRIIGPILEQDEGREKVEG